MTSRKRKTGEEQYARPDPLSHPCVVPSCLAGRGIWCRDSKGRRRPRLHGPRLDAALQQAADDLAAGLAPSPNWQPARRT